MLCGRVKQGRKRKVHGVGEWLPMKLPQSLTEQVTDS